jgi:hypothetical protein
MKNRDIVIAGCAGTKIDFKTGRSTGDLAGEVMARALTGACVRGHTQNGAIQKGSA